MSEVIRVTIEELADIATRELDGDFVRIDVELVDGEFIQRRRQGGEGGKVVPQWVIEWTRAHSSS